MALFIAAIAQPVVRQQTARSDRTLSRSSSSRRHGSGGIGRVGAIGCARGGSGGRNAGSIIRAGERLARLDTSSKFCERDAFPGGYAEDRLDDLIQL